MNTKELSQIEGFFRRFVVPLLDEDGTADYRLIWEFEKYLDSKSREIASSQEQDVRAWQLPLLSK
jgi:hypothetical protein